MIGTQASMLMIKSNSIMIRVGGGYETLENHINHIGQFECIKIYKLMKTGDPANKININDVRRQPPVWNFTQAVEFYLKKLKAAEKVVR